MNCNRRGVATLAVIGRFLNVRRDLPIRQGRKRRDSGYPALQRDVLGYVRRGAESAPYLCLWAVI
ncbi:hypothetical protein Oter_0007 [Opitutus terrae PB90-1]|uniref:Uncharacterized protein n=1 Tax=Opitutus terrae (strain DSM 11246 / JCM 15787 / PB90-1) TaxID=452637 RepID=B1ZWH5_OPITP|nr:hypothetical protein Oter_0007 [Opitutus terrae PB90-1]